VLFASFSERDTINRKRAAGLVRLQREPSARLLRRRLEQDGTPE
jgi:hypothetical protein